MTQKFVWLAAFAIATAGHLSAQNTVVPVTGATPALTSVTINAGSGDQFNPRVSGDWAAYTSDTGLRYYNFSTGIDAAIPMGASASDLLSDISGSKIAFSRVLVGIKTATMVFDAATPLIAPIEVDPAAGTTRIGTSIGGKTVAYIDFGLQANGELVVSDLVSLVSTRITNDTVADGNPKISPDGNVVVWEHCPGSITNCDISQAVKTVSGWTTSVVSSALAAEGNPDTNGTLVVYDSRDSTKRGIAWRPVGGGVETQLVLQGWQNTPTIAGHYISFESRATIFDAADIFVYDLLTNKLYQITNTPLVNEQLNDIAVLPDGRVRIVWCSDEDGADLRNLHAATFTLPGTTPTPADLIQQLIDLVATFNLRNGIANSLDAKLANVQSALASIKAGNVSNACGMLSAFISEVQAQSGKWMTTAQAAQLIDLANQALTGLGCR